MNRIALCLSGHLNDFWETAPSLNVLTESADIFIHTWNYLYGHSDDIVYNHLPKITDIYNPKSLQIEDYYEVNMARFEVFPNELRVNHMINMFYKVKACNELIYKQEDADQYNIGIRASADLLFTAPIPDIELYIADKNNSILYMTEEDIKKDYATRFAFGSARAMRVYSHCIDHIDSLYVTEVPLEKEALLKAHLENHKITVLPSKAKYEIYQA